MKRIDAHGIVTIVVLLSVWELVGRAFPSSLLPPPSAVVAAFGRAARDGGLGENYRASLERVAFGFALGSGAGIVIGALLAVSRIVEAVLGPLIATLRQIPLFGLLPLLGLWLGIGESAKIALVALACFYPVVLNTHAGLAGVPESYREVGTILLFDRWRRLTRILLPAALPEILTGLRNGLSFAWIAVVAAELFLAAAPGLGNILQAGREQFRMDTVLAGIALIAITGATMNIGLARLERRLLRWRIAFA